MLKTLHDIVTDEHLYDARHCFAYSKKGTISWQDFQCEVHAFQTLLADFNSRHVAIYQLCPVRFLACLVATWRLNKVAVISANGFRDISHLVPSLETTTGSPPADINVIHEVEFPEPSSGQDDETALIVYTSGSSGEPKAIHKTCLQLETEVSILDKQWGQDIANTVFVLSVSHHHMYGLPFGLLWPLLRGAPFYAETLLYAESLESLAERFPITLVTSPVQLAHLPDNLDTHRLQSSIVAVFSAGAALPEKSATNCLNRYGRPVTEIYGSTETGAVAWRRRPDEQLWQSLPNVVVATEPESQQLKISSPAITPREKSWLVVADTGTVHSPSTFALGPRSDRIIKMAGKRISLDALEHSLKAHPWVVDCKVVLLPERKSRLGAVVTMTAEANNHLIDKGKLATSRILAQHLATQTDRTTIPRYWRFLQALPRDTQAKVSTPMLVDLFHPERLPKLPSLLTRQVIDEKTHYQLTLSVPETLSFFAGHFPGNPVLPGVVQVDWAIHFARQVFEGLESFSALEVVKFQQVIQPGYPLTLDLQWKPEKLKLEFSYSSTKAQHSTGRIKFNDIR